MAETRVKIQSIVESQLPDFVADEAPLLVEFLKQYYISQEFPSGSYDLIQNIDQYIKIDEIVKSAGSCILGADVSYTDTTITVQQGGQNLLPGTSGFPERYGILKINDEIITYTSKTASTFNNCVRGFSGVTSYSKPTQPEELVFSTSKVATHEEGAVVYNLSGLFLDEFLKKLKRQILPGFDGRDLDTDLNENLFIKQSKDFYSSKGTDRAFKILFGALYGETVDVIKPKDFLFAPSDAGYRRTKDLVVEKISGNPVNLLNNTLYQDSYPQYGIDNSYASVTDVEKISIGGTDYYKLSFDADFNKDLVLEGTVYGNFTVHPKSSVITPVSTGSTVIDVDSTVGFAQSGELFATYGSGSTGIVSYTSKSITQFFGVTNVTAGINTGSAIRLNVNAYGYSGIDTSNPITVRIGSVLDKVVIPEKTYLFNKNDTGKLKSLGISSNTIRRDNWIDNIANSYDISSFSVKDLSNYTYSLTTYNIHNLRVGDSVLFTRSDSVKTEGTVIDVNGKYTFTSSGQGELISSYSYVVQKRLTKVKSVDYGFLNVNNANIQNTYTNHDDQTLVASPSLPFYYGTDLDPYDRKVVFSGSFSGEDLDIISSDPRNRNDHGFYTGDRIYYSPNVAITTSPDGAGGVIENESVSKLDGLEEGLYYVSRINESKLRLSKSPSDLFEGDYISVSGIVTSNVIQDYNFTNKIIQPQDILREVKPPVNRSGEYPTEPGKVGILVNGVEILNHKSPETVFYGKIEEIEITAPGSSYDVINPPSLDITDGTVGSGATGICAVEGSFTRLEILDSGFDYLDKPVITIAGGNGKDAAAEANMRSIEHFASFNSEDTDYIGMGTDAIGFTSYHKFRDAERVIYKSNGQAGLVGLTTGASYFARVIDALTIKLHIKENDAILGINTVNIAGLGTGIQEFKSAKNKSIISDIVVTNPGEGYQNKQRTTTIAGISTVLNTINIVSHGYKQGEELTYSTTGTVISGLVTTANYLVDRVNNDSFKLAPVGLGTTSKTEYLDSKQYIDFTSTGSGVHSFNYPSISVVITGNIGVSTLANQDFSARVQPVFRGSIDSVYLTASGSNYGSSDILNYNRQPLAEFRSGKDAELLPIINDGKITEVLILRGGSGYNCPPDLEINGTGKYARLVPVVEGGQLTEIKILSGGSGYQTEGTLIDVVAAGKDCKIKAHIQKWTVNLFRKYYENITPDDGIITTGLKESGGLEYCHLYAPRKLREAVYVRLQEQEGVEDTILYGVTDLRMSGAEEQPSSYHSPIIGWAYDGNPIYGPYGYTTPTGGTARALKSGYESVSPTNRPSSTNFPAGFFNEDFEFKNTGDLDEHNGRFGVTPEYPNGVYAYFATINSSTRNSSPPFQGYYEPSYPYCIGTSFYSQPNPFNFSKESDQDDYDLNNYKWFRNTVKYALKESNSFYDFVFNPDSLRHQTVNINYASRGGVDSIGIVTGGNNYKVNDRVVFDNSGTGGSGASAKVERVFGKNVSEVSVATTSFSSVEFATLDGVGQVIGFTTAPHKLRDAEILNVAGLNTAFAKLQGTYALGIRSDSFVTTLGVGTTGVTGLTTYFYCTGLLDFPYVRPNDILGIGTERVQVLNVEGNSGRIRVLRQVDGTPGAAHSSGTPLYEDPRKFRINSGFRTDYSYNVNREIYFDPHEAVGVGTSAIAGIGTTISFSTPGIGVTQVFAQYQQIYLPNHGLKTGERITYSTHGGSEIGVQLDGSKFTLPQTQDLYAANISKNFVGISTVKVGLGTTGTFIGIGTTAGTGSGLVFFRNFGTGTNHSFKTKRTVISGEIGKNIVTVSTGSTHGLQLGESVDFTSVPIDGETITVKYDDNNRRATFRSKTFVSGDVNTTEDTISITNHGLSTGDKVIYTASTVVGGLVNEDMYYVLYYTKDKIRLCASRYDLYLNLPKYIDFTSASGGTISLINPNLKIYRNKIAKFNLGDSSLASVVGVNSYSSFELNFYKDSQFKYKFESTATSNTFQVTRTGQVGIDTDAVTSLILNDDFPEVLYYKLDVVNKSLIADIKSQIVVDTDVTDNSQINLVDSKYSGSHRLSGIASTSFTFDLAEYPEAASYTKSVSNLYYTTNSTNAYGPISNIVMQGSGTKYYDTPGISTVTSTFGKGALLEVETTSIGKIVSNEIEDIGFDYPSDFTLSPSLNLPEVVQINPLASFSHIGITSAGKNYLTPPGLVVLDGYTGKVVDDVLLRYEIGETKVKIRRNTFGMYDVEPTILPINNSNGVGINSFSYDSTYKRVTVGFNTGFSDSFPFAVGDTVLIENISVGIASTAKGYNSDAYNYKLFPIVAVSPQLGGDQGNITYDMSDVLAPNEYPGAYNASQSRGRAIPPKDFPIFDIQLKKNDFLLGETVTSGIQKGVVESWNNKTEFLKVSTDKDLKKGDILSGETSSTKGVIIDRVDFDAHINVGPTASVNKGWRYDTGMLNNNVQRLPDNDYYQQFSYSLKSKVPLETWDNAVSSLNHTAGFLKFSDLMIETQQSRFVRDNKELDSDTTATVDFTGFGNLNCTYVFDLASENTSILPGGGMVSNEIVFENRVLTDFYESVGNRVLQIDDMSSTFSHKPRPTRYSEVNRFDLDASRTKKYFTFVRDKRYTAERQLLIVSLLQNGSRGYLNQYGRVETHPDLGSFDFAIDGSDGTLDFYPIKYKKNNYDVTYISHDLSSEVAGIGSTALGDFVHINSHQVTANAASTTALTIVGIASTYRSAKVLVEIGGTDGSYYEFDELNLIHDGTTVDLVEYGQLTDNNVSSFGIGGLGTYYSYIDGSRVKIDWTPNSALGVAHTINSMSISIASSTTTATGVGTYQLNTGNLDSWYTSISRSASPGITTIAEFANEDSSGDTLDGCAYYVVQIEDSTNDRYEMAEVVVATDETDDGTVYTEYGNVQMHTSGLGTIGAGIMPNSAARTALHFTPNANIDVQVRVFQNSVGLFQEGLDKDQINLENALIRANRGTYEGTETSIKRAFGLLHDNRPIFQRYFVGSAATVVNLTNNTINIPDHFFVTGEELRYSFAGAATTQAIGIASTVVTGIGTTDKMPETVYAIVQDDKSIQLAKSATDALSALAVPLDFTSVGVGTSHCFISRNPNAKALIALDNFIQSPIVGTSLTTTLSKNVTVNDVKVTFSGITSFIGGDLVKINSEIMKINTVGVGSTNIILMDREWLGTGIGTHGVGDIVTKIEGNYNIVDNILNFVEAPYGLDPISSTTNAPDDRDWVGIATHSTFQGRTFMRSGITDASDATYSTNFVLDDISSEFTGIAKTFTLTSDDSNISGISTSNGVILINGIFQGPPSDDGETEDYELTESAGITSITFTGTASSVTFDVNNANIPVGGVIVSVGSTEGFGLQPLVAAGATPVISAAGTVQSISIGNSGSGYRVGIQTTVNVAIQTSSLYTANYTGIGTAQITDGHITGVAITNPHVFHVPANVSNVGYSSVTGITTITTVTDHGLQRGEAINLSGIAFTCDYAAPISISTAAYTSTTGIMTVTTTGAHGLSTTGKSSVVIFTGLAFTCGLDAGVSTHFYPRGQDYAYDNAVSIASSTTNTVTVNVGVAGPGDQYAHTFKRASTNALVSGGDYLHSFVSGVTSCVVSGGNYLHTFDSVGVTSITVTGIGSTVPTDATYAPLTGELVLTVGSGHTYTTSDTVGIGTSALVFSCAMDQDGTTHSYPRSDDPVAGVNTAITAVTDSTITVNVGTSRSVFFDVYDAQYTGSTGIMTLNIGSHTLKTGKSIRLMNEGLSFRCAMDSNKTIHKYPRSTDPYYDTAISIAATTANTIALNVGITSLVYNDVSAATYDAATGDLVLTVGSGHSLNTGTKIKIAESSLTFTCARDAHASEHSYPRKPDPMYGGVPVSTVGVGTTTFTVQVGISTVPTYYQGGGTVQAAIVAPRAKNFSTSGTDSASPGVAVEQVVDSKTIIVNTGVSTRTHFYARGGKIEKNLDVKFDDPLSYSNMDLVYSSESVQGIGTYATIDVVVGQGSSVIDFAITNTGYGFGAGEILTVDIGGTAGIPTDTSLTYKEFQLTIKDIYKDSFSGWTVGDFQVLDDWDELVDGVTRKYPLKSNGEYLTIRAAKGSQIDVKDCLLIFVNDILQKPGEAYVFLGGSVVTFSEPLRSGDTTKVIFYKGTGDVDVVFRDILETVKEGDEITLNYDTALNQGDWLQQYERVVTGIVTTDTVQTNPYSGPGITTDDTLLRPAKWCRQTVDKIIDGALISKARPHYEPNIFPSTLLTQSVGVGSTYCFVESLKPFFDAEDEDNTAKNTYTVEIVSQDVKTSAAATATVSTAGTISSFTVTDAGYGYVSAPSVSVANPTGFGTYRDVGIGTTHRATGIATIGSGIVTSITVSTQGMGYTSTNPPLVLVGDSIPVRNKVTKATYTGDYGEIIGIRADSVGVASTALVFDLMIPPDSYLRDSEYVSGVTTVSGIQTGYFFTVSNSNIGGGVTSLYSDGSNLGIGTSYLDNVYEVAAVGIATTLAITLGYGVTAIAQVTVSVASTNGVTGFGQSNFYGNYSWGKVVFGARANPSAFNAYTNDGMTGLTTSAILRRLYPLKSKNYN